MSDNTEKPADLVPVTDWLEIIKFFDQGARAKAGVMIWTKNGKASANCSVISLSQAEKMFFTTSVKSPDPSQTYAEFTAAGDKCCLNLKLEKATLLFTSKMESVTPSTLSFSLPTKVFKVQRRQRQRFKILQGYVLRVIFQDPKNPTNVYKPKVYDVSSNGISFLMGNEEAANFEAGQILKNMTFTIRTHVYTVDGQIIHCKPYVEAGPVQKQIQMKFGVKFLNMNEADANNIDEYVFDENRKFYTRFM